jgi:hypothetical protein
MITGKDLISMGYEPNKMFGIALEHINKNSLSTEQIHEYMESIKIVHIEPHAEPVGYVMNIRATDETEAANVFFILK